MKEFKLNIFDAMPEILLDLVCSWKICLLDCLEIKSSANKLALLAAQLTLQAVDAKIMPGC